MPLNCQEILRACETLAEAEGLNVCLKQSLKGAAIAGLGSFIFGVLMGPIGVALGGAVGGVAGAKMCSYYKPLIEVIHEMNEDQKKQLVEHMMRAVEGLDVTDAVVLMTLIAKPEELVRHQMLNGIRSYFGNQIMPN